MNQHINSLFIGRNRIHLDSTLSTNSSLLELSQQSELPEGTVLITDEQKAGRGQGGNSWFSEAKQNLTCSILLRPKFLSASEQFSLNVLASLSIQDLCCHYGISAQVKWPNDVICRQGKLSGVLIQSKLQGNSIAQAILGIGLNINQLRFPDGVFASSLALELGEELDVKEIEAKLYIFLEQRYLKMKKDKHVFFHQYCDETGLMGEDVQVVMDGEQKEVTVLNLNKDGSLLIKEKGEKMRTLTHPQIRLA